MSATPVAQEELDRVRAVARSRGRPASGRIRVEQRPGTLTRRLPRTHMAPSSDMVAYRKAYKAWQKGDKTKFSVSPYVDKQNRQPRASTRPASKSAFAKAHPKFERAIQWGLTPSTRGGPLGTLYLFGGNGPRYDCSSLTQSIMRRAGINIPRVSRDQFRHGKAVSKKHLQRGDLLFWSGTWRSGISHVAIYLGNGLMLEAPSSGKRVRVTAARINASNYSGARRYI
jgi:cell wall-associated NlpC family hydrolase